MFDSKFSLVRFGISTTSKEITFSRNMTETIDCVAGGRLYLHFTRDVSESLNGLTELRMLIPYARSLQESVSSQSVIYKFMLLNRSPTDTILCTAYVTKEMGVVKNTLEEIKTLVYVGKISNFAKESKEAFYGVLRASKIMNFEKINTEIINCDTNASTTRYESFTLNMSIPAGEEVLIDSDTFTAVMGIQNILPAYSGTWVFLSRDTIQVNIDTGTGGNITGEILYSERYI